MRKETLIFILLVLSLFALLAIGGLAAYLMVGSTEKKEATHPAQIPGSSTRVKEMTTQPEKSTVVEAVDISDWKTYRNEKYGFEIKYPYIFKEIAENEVWFGFPPNLEGNVKILVSPVLTIYSPNAAGYLSETEAEKILEERKGTPFYEEKVINSNSFSILYSISYQGMGAWVENIYCITKNKKNSNFYIITLTHPFMANPESPRGAIVNVHLQTLRNGSAKFVEVFWRMINSFELIGAEK